MLMRSLQEKKLHGQPDFPFVVYPGRLPKFGTEFPLHWHEEVELICIHSGIGIITVQAQTYTVREGDLILIPPGTVHSIRQYGQEEMTYHTVLFRLSLLERDDRCKQYTAVLRDARKEKPTYLPKGNELNETLTAPLMALLEHRKKQNTVFDLMVYSYLYQILYQIVCRCPDAAAEQVRKNASYEKLQELLSWLKEHYREETTVAEAAARCGFSESHFMRLFRELTGTSFAQYTKQLRLIAAAEQLRATGCRVGEIAENVGFRNLSYFTRAFTEKYHMSPGEYRRKWQSGG